MNSNIGRMPCEQQRSAPCDRPFFIVYCNEMKNQCTGRKRCIFTTWGYKRSIKLWKSKINPSTAEMPLIGEGLLPIMQNTVIFTRPCSTRMNMKSVGRGAQKAACRNRSRRIYDQALCGHAGIKKAICRINRRQKEV